MRKILNYIMIISLVVSSFAFSSPVLASISATVTGNGVRIRTSTDTNSLSNVITSVNSGTKLTVTNTSVGANNSCSKWFQINYNNQTAYICGEFVSLSTDTGVSVNDNLQVGYVTGTKVNVRTSPSTSSSVMETLNVGDRVNIISYSNNWYKILIHDDVAYITGDFVTTDPSSLLSNSEATSFKSYLQNQGFPTTYWGSLIVLHAKYPNWIFKAINTSLDWEASVTAESYVGTSLIYSSYDKGYYSLADGSYNSSNDTYNQIEPGWYAANSNTVAYYMDPRNNLSEKSIMMFEDWSYQSSYQTVEAVNQIIADTSYSSLASSFMSGASKYNISPIHSASRVRQEIGYSSVASTGESFVYEYDSVYKKGNGQTYTGIYNFYNIGAFAYKRPAIAGLIWANGGENGTETSYGRPWKTRESSIEGGMNYLASKYINAGQYTTYFQRFNVAPTATHTKYTYQYMTNIMAPRSEAIKTYNSYVDLSILDKNLVFYIPYYSNMPEKTILTKSANSNNYLSSISVNGIKLENFTQDVTTYEYGVDASTSSVTVGATKISASSNVSGTGTISLNSTRTTANIVVTAENNTSRTYSIVFVKNTSSTPNTDTGSTPDIDDSDKNTDTNIPVVTSLNPDDIMNKSSYKHDDYYITGLTIKSSIGDFKSKITSIENKSNITIRDKNGGTKASGNFATGDVVTINSNNKSKNYTAVVLGDNNGDGTINLVDLLRIQKRLLKSINLDGAYWKAADVNNDNNVTLVDLLRVQKHILGNITIE
ncbi:MAG: SH3 domain-containing protein [bacterium]|nr:SH3 domain-containing protein [bacterium]